MKNEINEQDRLNLEKKFDLVDEKQDGWLGYMKLDPSIFAYHFFLNDIGGKFKVFPHQDLILNDKSPLRLLNLARGAGKSTIAALNAIHFSYWNDNSLVLIMSSTKPQALEVVRKIKMFLRTGKFISWKELSPRGKENKAEVELKNAGKKTTSRIISVPATDAARGYSPHLIICDELAFWEESDIFEKVVLGMLNRIDGVNRKIMALSTPNGRHGPFWNCYNNKNWSVYNFNWRINPYNTESKMEALRTTMTDLQFRAEYEAEFVSSRDAYFTYDEIKRSINRESNQGYKGEVNCAVGVDFGKINDFCVINIGSILNPEEKPARHIIRVIDRRVKSLGTDYSLILSELKAINESIHPNIFILDATGVGEAPADLLRSQGLPVEAFKFSLYSKVTIMNNLKILMQQSRIQIPDEKELLEQLECFEYEASKSGGVAQPKLHAPEGLHDDEVDSLALMAYGLIRKGYYYSSFIPSGIQSSSGFDENTKRIVKANNKFIDMINANKLGTMF